jgi:hypothetical protein
MILKLPAQINAPRFRKDGSISLSFDSRELTPEELMFVLGCRNSEGWLMYAQTSEISQQDIPTTKPDLDLKSSSQRLKDVLYVFYKQETDAQKFVGSFDTFYSEKMEKLIEMIKTKLHD